MTGDCMGLLSDVAVSIGKGVAKKVITPIAIDGAVSALDKFEKRQDKKAENKLEKLYKKNPDHVYLLVTRPIKSIKETYNVYDINHNVRYTVKGELVSLKAHLHIKDANKKEVGFIKENLIALRNPIKLVHEDNPKDFVVEVHGEKIGKIKTAPSYTRTRFEIGFNGWSAEGDIFKNNYTVYKGNEIAMRTTEEFTLGKDTYLIDIYDKKNELLGLIVAVTLAAATTPKN